MKKTIKLLMSVMFMSGTAMASEKWPVRPGGDLIIMVSPGYNSFLNDAYTGVSGGQGWIGGDLGLLIRLSDRFALQPKIEGYFNSVELSGSTSSGSYSNVMGVPALALRTFLYQHGAIELGLNGQIGAPMISSDLTDVSMKAKGLGFAFSGGLRIKKSVDIQLGYSYYPVEVTMTHNPYTYMPYGSRVASLVPATTTETKTYNFGGIFLSAGYYF